jgi:hypothetical protein
LLKYVLYIKSTILVYSYFKVSNYLIKYKLK